MKNNIEFIGYNGKWPCLCFGTLEIKVNDKLYCLDNAMVSGGCVSFDSDWNENVTTGPWELDLEEFPELEEYKDEITELVNDNVEWGCCGGCV